MVGELLMWQPDLPPQAAKRIIQNAYRRIIDSRNFYGTLLKGQITVPNAYTTGQVTTTTNSNIVTGVGTNWTPDMVGYQFRIGFSTPIYTITNVISPNQLQVDLAWGAPSQSGTSYQVFNNIVSFGANIKRLYTVVNQQQGYRLKLNIPQEVLNIYDTWRTTTGWTYIVANYAPSADGQPQYELYPAPTFQQSFPFLAFTQPQDLVNDGDFPALSVRSDVIMYGSIPHALLFRGKTNKYYDPQTAMYFTKQFEAELQSNKMNDNDLYQRDLMWEYDKYPFTQFGSDWFQSHEDVPG